MRIFVYNVTGAERKRLAQTIAELFGCPCKYLGTPTFAYQVGNKFLISRTGSVFPDMRVSETELWTLFRGLLDRGFTPEWDMMTEGMKTAFSAPLAAVAPGEVSAHAETEKTRQAAVTAELCGFCVELPREGVTDAALENLRKLVDSKAALIRKALGADRLHIYADAERILFPWFDAAPDADMASAAVRFIERLTAVAKTQKRVTAKEHAVENEKYAFRCFLLKLGFIGAEYKSERKTLLRNLTGSAAFRDSSRRTRGDGV